MPVKTRTSSFFQLLGKYKFLYFSSLICSFIPVLLSAIEPRIFQLLIDALSNIKAASATYAPQDFLSRIFYNKILPDLTNQNITSIIIIFCISYMIILLARAILAYLIKVANSIISEKAMKDLRDKLFEHILKLPIKYFNGSSLGSLTQRCTSDIEYYKRFMQDSLFAITQIIAIISFSFIMIFMTNWIFGSIILTLLPASIYVNYIYFKKEQKTWTNYQSTSDSLNTNINEALEGIKTIKAYSYENKAIKKFILLNSWNTNIAVVQAKIQAFYMPISYLILLIQILIAIFVGGYLAITKALTIGEFASCFLYVNMIRYPLKNLIHSLTNYSKAKVAVNRVTEILDKETENLSSKKVPTNKPIGKIEFKNVSFKYSFHGDYILKNASFRIHSGEKVVITGSTGAGKTTIIKLLLRFYEPLSGKILIDDKDIKEFSKSFLRRKIGVCLQNTMLFSDTINDNLKLIKPRASDKEIDKALEQASFSDAFIDERGSLNIEKDHISAKHLSGGQRQRLSIARALLGKPDIFILDDATSNIDEITEMKILDSILNNYKDKTTITITHKFKSMVIADKIIIVENGETFISKNIKGSILEDDYVKTAYSLLN